MPDETEPNQPPQPPQTPEQRPSGGAYTQGEKISKINVADEIKNSFLDYSMSVIISRALPDVRDGLKPSQRRILFAMEQLNLFPGRKHMKCAKICGDTSGNYHPHGEAVIYPTLVHMAQPWAMRERLVDGKVGQRGRDLPPPLTPGLHEGEQAPDGQRLARAGARDEFRDVRACHASLASHRPDSVRRQRATLPGRGAHLCTHPRGRHATCHEDAQLTRADRATHRGGMADSPGPNGQHAAVDRTTQVRGWGPSR